MILQSTAGIYWSASNTQKLFIKNSSAKIITLLDALSDTHFYDTARLNRS